MTTLPATGPVTSPPRPPADRDHRRVLAVLRYLGTG